jgi:hypothetical protein
MAEREKKRNSYEIKLDSGALTIYWPATVSASDLAEIEMALKLVQAQIARAARKSAGE